MTTTIEKWSLLAIARFVLAFIVMVGHIEYLHYAPLGALWWVSPLGAFQAVLGFLLISGFSIGASYGKEPVGFLSSAPCASILFISGLSLACVATPPALSAGTLIQNLLFTEPAHHRTRRWSRPAWSLALEVWLYCLTPWLGACEPPTFTS